MAADRVAEKVEDRAAVVGFNHVVGLEQGPTSDRRLLHEALAALVPTGMTSLVDAMYSGLLLGTIGQDQFTGVPRFTFGVVCCRKWPSNLLTSGEVGYPYELDPTRAAEAARPDSKRATHKRRISEDQRSKRLSFDSRLFASIRG